MAVIGCTATLMFAFLPLLALPGPPHVPVVPCRFLGPLQVEKVAETGGGSALRGTKAPLGDRAAWVRLSVSLG